MLRFLCKMMTVFYALLAFNFAQAGVVMSNTRVIYSSSDSEKSVQLTNADDIPSLVQVWVDNNNPDSTPETAGADFFVSPSVFRLEPKMGQLVRLIYAGDPLPADRESIFYFNFLQIPSVNSDQSGKNKMLIIQKSRVKVFYRPASLARGVEKVAEKIVFSIKQENKSWRVTAKNPTEYFISLVAGNLAVNDKNYELKLNMVAPFSEKSWLIDHGGPVPPGEKNMKFYYINDYGAQIAGNFIVN